MSEELEAKLIDALATVRLREQKIMELTSASAAHLRRAEAAEKRAVEAEAALERDRTTVAMAVTAMRDAMTRREWLLESRGPYEWDDDRYRDEFGQALKEISVPIDQLKKIARDWTNCPSTTREVQAARDGMPKFGHGQ